MTIERKLWGGVMHMGGTEFSIGSCIPIKYINQGKPLGFSFHQKSLPYWPNHFSLTIHSGSHRLGPWVIKIIPGFAGFFNDFCWKYEHTSYYISSSLTGILLLATYTLARRDPSSGLTEILFFFLYYYYYYSFLFPSFWDFGPSWSFLTSWIGPSFVKAHDLSLLFMECAFLWNFGPQHPLSTPIQHDLGIFSFTVLIFFKNL